LVKNVKNGLFASWSRSHINRMLGKLNLSQGGRTESWLQIWVLKSTNWFRKYEV
jgi:hypothetical protein